MMLKKSDQVYSERLVHLLVMAADLKLSDSEFSEAAMQIHRLLEEESNGKTHLLLHHDELSAPVRALLNTRPLVLEEANTSEFRLFSQRTHTALEGVWHWFEERTQTEGADTKKQLDTNMKFVPTHSGEGSLALGQDDQVPAILKAVQNSFTVITGGPGTGKTTIVAACLAELLTREPELNPEQIALCAPTGKAAQRLSEGIAFFNAAYLGNSPDDLRDRMRAIPDAKTLHKLLGASPERSLPLSGEVENLPYSVIVMDECSMVGAELMCALMKSIAPHTRLILVGDADQLPSVECGDAFSEIVARLESQNSQQIQRLKHSRRTSEEGKQILVEAKKALEHGIVADFDWSLLDPNENIASTPVRFISGIRGLEKRKFSEWLDELLSRIFLRFAEQPTWSREDLTLFKIITPNREGLGGVRDINQRMHELARTTWKMQRPGYLIGEPVMVMENIHHLGLNNGDVGVVQPRLTRKSKSLAAQTELEVRFVRGPSNQVYSIDQLTGRIERAWASTCHKAQGSEYKNVFIVLPGLENQLVTPKWLYTAITRAKSRVMVIRNTAS
jgi:exodeoxyribonuclease V alpha subunit